MEVIKFLQKESGYDKHSDLEEWLMDVAKNVYKEIGSSHRWYDEEFRVVKVKDKFVAYEWYHMTGDYSPYDMDLEFDWNSVRFVEPYEVTMTKYK